MSARALLFLLVPLGCGEPVPYDGPVEGDADTDSDTDTDTDTDTDDELDHTPVSGTVSFVDLDSAELVVDVRVTVDGDNFDDGLDDAGIVAVEAPGNATTDAELYKSTYLRGYLTLATDAASGWSGTVPFVRQAFIDVISPVFDAPYDADLATVLVSVVQPDGVGGWEPAAGAVVALDVTAAATVNKTERGFEEGGELEEGGRDFVAFLNVPVGPVNVTVTPPGGLTCTTFPSTTRLDTALTTVADAVATLLVTCQ